MTAAAFDTLSAARDLKAAGIEPEHAEAIVEGMRRAATADRGESATKADLDTAVATLRTEIAQLETRLTWQALGIAGLILAAVKLIPPAY